MQNREQKTMVKAPVRMASVGLGWVTIHRHLPVLAGMSDVKVVGVVDSHPGRAKELAKAHRIRFYSEERELSRVPWLDMVDAVAIGAGPMAHYALIREALAAGKHVITEKPFAMKVTEGEELVRMSRERGLVLGIVHNFQFARCTRRLINDMESGELGTIRAIHALQFSNPRRRLPKWHNELPLGLFYDESPHLFYMLRRLAPGGLSLMNLSVFPSSLGTRTPALIQALYRGRSRRGPEIPIDVTLNFEATVSEWHFAVMGEKRLGDIDIFRDIYVRLPNDRRHTTATVFRTTLSAVWGHLSEHMISGVRHFTGRLFYGNDEVFRRFVDAVKGERPLQDVTGEDALSVLRMQHEIIDASRNG
jgi:scyllo-inositol 2-dehydrogenase (NADP+)